MIKQFSPEMPVKEYLVELSRTLRNQKPTTTTFVAPVLTTAQRDAVKPVAAGMVIFNSTTGVLNFHNGTAWGAV